MAEKKKAKMVMGRPEDKSLAAFKTFIKEFCADLGVKNADTVTEEELKKAHKEFWSPKTGE